MAPLAVLAALSLAVVSFACVVACCSVEAAMPPCHHHARSCAPLLLAGEAPGVSVSAAVQQAFAISLPAEVRASEMHTSIEPVPFFSSPEPSLRTLAILRI